jgi:putative salt-induced outer membrane protein
MFRRALIVPVAIILWPLSSFAHEEEAAEEEDTSPWSGAVSFGYLATSGNTENSNLNSSFEVGYTTGKWDHLFDAYAINASENNVNTAEAYGAGWISEYNISEFSFLFGRLSYRNDRFSGFRTQFSQAVGYGHRFINSSAHVLSAQAGGGARQSERADGVDENDFILDAALNYKWTFSESAYFSQDFAIEYGENNTYLESVSAVTARLVGQLSLVASYTIKNNSDVPVGSEKSDTFSAIALEYAF